MLCAYTGGVTLAYQFAEAACGWSLSMCHMQCILLLNMQFCWGQRHSARLYPRWLSCNKTGDKLFYAFFQRVRMLLATLCILKPLACNLLHSCLVAQQLRINTLKKRLLDQRMMRFLGTCSRRKVHRLKLLFRVAIDRWGHFANIRRRWQSRNAVQDAHLSRYYSRHFLSFVGRHSQLRWKRMNSKLRS